MRRAVTREERHRLRRTATEEERRECGGEGTGAHPNDCSRFAARALINFAQRGALV
jgi:hypothetical protein